MIVILQWSIWLCCCAFFVASRILDRYVLVLYVCLSCRWDCCCGVVIYIIKMWWRRHIHFFVNQTTRFDFESNTWTSKSNKKNLKNPWSTVWQKRSWVDWVEWVSVSCLKSHFSCYSSIARYCMHRQAHTRMWSYCSCFWERERERWYLKNV